MVWRYELHGWRRCGGGEPGGGFVMRPGPRTLLLRLRVTLWAALLIAVVRGGSRAALRLLARPHSASPPARTAEGDRLSRDIAALERDLSPAGRSRVAEAEAARQQRAAALEARNRRWVGAIHWTVAALVAAAAFIGIGVPLSALWNRLIVTSPEPGVLKLVETGWWRRSRSIPLALYVPPVLSQYELKTAGAGYFTWIPSTRTWAWVLVLSPISDVTSPRVEFWLRALSRPASGDAIPEQELAEFVRPLEALTRAS